MATAVRSSVLFVLVIALATLVSCGCPTTPSSISSISPVSATAGGNDFVLTVSGKNFRSESVVDFNGTSVTPSSVSSTQLVATIPAANIAQPGTLAVFVLNPPSGGSTSTSSEGITTTQPTCGGSDSNAVSFTVSP